MSRLNQKFLFLFLSAAAGAAAVFFGFQGRSDSVFADARAEYEIFKRETAENPDSGWRHFLAHQFGESLYNDVGLSGIGICDDSFDYGCYHSFLGAAITDRGLDIIQNLDRACDEQFGPDDVNCQHGIGHGIVGHLGYELENLLAALDLCKTLASKGPLAGCKSGAFMEYNQQTLHDPPESGPGGRPLTDAGPHTPCRTVPEEFVPACYSELPHWWKALYDWDYKKLANLCREAGADKLAEICIESIGHSLVSVYDGDESQIAAACGQMPAQDGEICLTAARSLLIK